MLADAERFLDERWRAKEQLLQRFIERQSFLPPPPKDGQQQQQQGGGEEGEVRVLRPRGSLVYVSWLLAFPSLFFLCLPLLSLGFLLLSPALVLAGTVQMLSAVLSPSSSSPVSSPHQTKKPSSSSSSTPPYPGPNKTPDLLGRAKTRWAGESQAWRRGTRLVLSHVVVDVTCCGLLLAGVAGESTEVALLSPN